MTSARRKRYWILGFVILALAVVVPGALYADGWVQLHFSGYSCVGGANQPLVYDSLNADGGVVTYMGAATNNSLNGTGVDAHCPLAMNSGIVPSTQGLPNGRTVERLAVVYESLGGANVTCGANITHFLLSTTAPGGITNSLTSIPSTPTPNQPPANSTVPAYITLIQPGTPGFFVTGDDFENTEVFCHLPPKTLTGAKAGIIGYTIAYSQ